MKNRLFKIFIIFGILFLSSCELYPDWEKNLEYSDSYPLSGEWYVTDYDMSGNNAYLDNNSAPIYYILYIYNKANNPTKDSIWIDNYTGHPSNMSVAYPYRFKIKTKADMNSLSFDCVKTGNVTGYNSNPLSSAVSVTISNSKVTDISQDITNPATDSISFNFTYYDELGNEVIKLKVAGHRKTGWEDPNYDDNM